MFLEWHILIGRLINPSMKRKKCFFFKTWSYDWCVCGGWVCGCVGVCVGGGVCVCVFCFCFCFLFCFLFLLCFLFMLCLFVCLFVCFFQFKAHKSIIWYIVFHFEKQIHENGASYLLPGSAPIFWKSPFARSHQQYWKVSKRNWKLMTLLSADCMPVACYIYNKY